MTTTKDHVLNCSFCRKTQHEVRKLIAGASVFICNECVSAVHDVQEERVTDALLGKVATPSSRSCDFCGNSAPSRQLYEGMGVCVCENCVRLCDDILGGDHRSQPPPHQAR